MTDRTPARPGAPQSSGNGLPLLDVVMLIDESGSETPVSVAQERQVSATIGQSMLNPGSRVTVVGFGGVNHVVPNQNAIDVACKPTIASGAANLDYLATCGNTLHRRTEQQGDDTDYAAALSQAMSYFQPNTLYGTQSPPGAIKIVLMMTDGAVDVHRDTQQYGQDWLAGVHQAINEQLALARQDHVQVWTLGMGTGIQSADEQYLQYLAGHGAKSPCGVTPHSTLVTDRADAMATLDRLYADAACDPGLIQTPTIPLAGGGSGTLHVTLPAFASEAAISVDRGDPNVRVSFYRPDGRLWTNSLAISGQGSQVDVLHLASPMPGTWTIKLTAPPGLRSQLVNATAFYQGAVRALITASPPNAQLGQRITVTLSVLGNNGPITDPTAIKDLHVQVNATGDGLTGSTPVPVSNAGENSSSGTGVANYTGTFQAPKTAGTLTFSGSANGYGLYSTDVPATAQVGQTSSFQATVRYPQTTSVQAGTALHGSIVFSNTTGAAKTVRATLTTSHAFASFTSPTGTVTVPNGSPPQVPFTISVAKDSPPGGALVTVKVFDAANPGTVYSDGPLYITVTKPPGFISKYLWAIIGVVVLIVLIVAAFVAERARRRRAVDVRALRASVSRDGGASSKEVRPPGKWSSTFRFIIPDADNMYARVELPQQGGTDPVYTAKRSGHRQVRVWTPAGEQLDIVVGSAGEPVADGLRLAFKDTRKRHSTRPPIPSRAAVPPTPYPAQPPAPAEGPAYTQDGTRTQQAEVQPEPVGSQDQWYDRPYPTPPNTPQQPQAPQQATRTDDEWL